MTIPIDDKKKPLTDKDIRLLKQIAEHGGIISDVVFKHLRLAEKDIQRLAKTSEV